MITAAQTQVREHAAAQKEKAAGGLRSLSDELRSLADGTGGKSGKMTDLSREASAKIKNMATWLERHEPAQLLEEFRAFARRKPGGFLLGASAAGALAGRLSRGAIDAGQDARTSPDQTTPGTARIAPSAGPGLRVSPSLSADRAVPVPDVAKDESLAGHEQPKPQPSALRGDLA